MVVATSKSIMHRGIRTSTTIIILVHATVEIDGKAFQQCQSSVSCGPGKMIHANLIWTVVADFREGILLLQ